MPIFVIQKHESKHLHYDFRLEIEGVLKSWAVPKGLSNSTKDKRLAILVPDHALSYANFEGVIPEGHYGAGKVIIWDKGKYKNLRKDETPSTSMQKAFEEGRIEVQLEGNRYKASYALVHFKENNWLIIKMKEK